MSTHPRVTTTARPQQPELVDPAERARLRCAAASGIAEPADMLRVLDHLALTDRVFVQMAKRTEEVGSPDEQARVAAALELVDPKAPLHIRIEFDYVAPMAVATVVEFLRDRTLEQLGRFVDQGRVTTTYRGESESWETKRDE